MATSRPHLCGCLLLPSSWCLLWGLPVHVQQLADGQNIRGLHHGDLGERRWVAGVAEEYGECLEHEGLLRRGDEQCHVLPWPRACRSFLGGGPLEGGELAAQQEQARQRLEDPVVESSARVLQDAGRSVDAEDGRGLWGARELAEERQVASARGQVHVARPRGGRACVVARRGSARMSHYPYGQCSEECRLVVTCSK